MNYNIYFVEVFIVDNNTPDYLTKSPVSKYKKFTMIDNLNLDEIKIKETIKNWFLVFKEKVEVKKLVLLNKENYNKEFIFCNACLYTIFSKCENVFGWSFTHYDTPQFNVVNYIKDIQYKIFYIGTNVDLFYHKKDIIQCKLENKNFLVKSEITFLNLEKTDVSLNDIVSILSKSDDSLYSFVIDPKTTKLATIIELTALISNMNNCKIYYLDKVDNIHDIRKNQGIIEIINGDNAI